MAAFRKVVAILNVSLTIVFVLTLFNARAAAQTSLNDVHVAPGQGTSVPSMRVAGKSMLDVIKTSTRLVLVPVSVTDSAQRLVTGLDRNNFQVVDGKRPQTINSFSSEDMPVSVGIILDVSGSMDDKMDRTREALTQFCKAANPEDEYFMIVFSDAPRLATDFTSSCEDLEHELLFTKPKGRTSLLDAIYMGLSKMKNARYGKKALLIVSDGGDNHSRYSDKEIKAAAKESDVMIYSIGVFDRYVPTMEELQGPTLLQEIAEPTGGRAFALDKPVEMPTVARRISVELRTQYVLGYRPQDMPHDGKWHKIKVTLRLPRKFPFLQAHAKTGYYAAAE